MRRLTLFISVALALLAFVIPATAGAKSHHKRHHHARVADRNHNGMPDRWERKFHVHKATADPDRDGVANIGEFHNGTNPRDADTDNDGIDDGNDDANHDGVDDADEQSGVIDSFDASTGKLTVKLVNGDSLTGTVNGDTEIECGDSAAPTTTASTRDDGGQTESGDDNSGSGSTSSGEDDTTEQQSGGDNSGSDSTNSGDNEQGDDSNEQGENENDNQNQGSCGTDALTQDTIVKEAELRLTSGGAVFEKIELGGKAPA